MAYEQGIFKFIGVKIGEEPEISVPVSSFSSGIASEVGKIPAAGKRNPYLLYAAWQT